MSALLLAQLSRAAFWAGEVKGLLLLDVTPLSLGLETHGRRMHQDHRKKHHHPDQEVPRFSPPLRITRPQVDIHVLQGEREMAQDNKTLGMFQSGRHRPGTAEAPRRSRLPSISTPTASCMFPRRTWAPARSSTSPSPPPPTMSKEDIDKAVKEAEQYAEADKKQREEVDIRNGADQMIFQTEKTLKDLDGKIDAADKSELETKLNALKEAVKGSNLDDIKAKQEDLQKKFYDVSAETLPECQPAGRPAWTGYEPEQRRQRQRPEQRRLCRR